MMWLVSGAYTGQPESYAVFIHPMLSWFFSVLYAWIPEFNWYGCTWFLVLGFSYFGIISRLSESQSASLSSHFLAFFFLIMVMHFAIFPQFTLVAGFAAFSAFVLVSPKSAKSSPWQVALGFLLFLLACLIRWESVVLIGLGFALFEVSRGPVDFFRTKMSIFLVLLVFFSGLLIGKIIWERQSEYADFLRFNRIRSGVIDHPVFRQEVMDKSISPGSDLFFFSRWFFEGDNPTEEELIKKKWDLDSQFFSLEQVLNSFSRLWDFHKIEAFKSFLSVVMVILYVFSFRSHHRTGFQFLLWIAFFLVFNHFFSIQSRVSFLFFLCLLFPVVNSDELNLDSRGLYLGFLLGFLAISYHFSNFLAEAKGRSIMVQEFAHLQSERDQSVPLIFEGYQEHNLDIQYSFRSPVPFLSTGWISRSRFQSDALHRFGLKNFSELDQFALITPSTNTEIVFPAYMNHAFGAFILTDSLTTANFILLHYKLRNEPEGD
jgi:hypothetical protein